MRQINVSSVEDDVNILLAKILDNDAASSEVILLTGKDLLPGWIGLLAGFDLLNIDMLEPHTLLTLAKSAPGSIQRFVRKKGSRATIALLDDIDIMIPLMGPCGYSTVLLFVQRAVGAGQHVIMTSSTDASLFGVYGSRALARKFLALLVTT